jgi:hypothetical protein
MLMEFAIGMVSVPDGRRSTGIENRTQSSGSPTPLLSRHAPMATYKSRSSRSFTVAPDFLAAKTISPVSSGWNR